MVDIFVDVETVIWLPKSFRALDYLVYIGCLCVFSNLLVVVVDLWIAIRCSLLGDRRNRRVIFGGFVSFLKS